jgi:enterochelin esterase family protein
MVGGPDYLGLNMSRLGQTNLFFVTQVAPNDARFIYAFILYKVHRAGPKGEVEVTEYVHSDDSIMEMPNAPAQPYVAAKENVPKGKTVQTTIKSAFLNEERKVTVYTPAGYDGKTGCNLLVVFDGVTYGGLPDQAQAEVPTPTILDNLIAEKKIGPTVAVLVWSMGKQTETCPQQAFRGLHCRRGAGRVRTTPSYPGRSGGRCRIQPGRVCATYAPSPILAIVIVISQSGSY